MVENLLVSVLVFIVTCNGFYARERAQVVCSMLTPIDLSRLMISTPNTRKPNPYIVF